MKLTKKVQGHDINLEIERIKDYPRYSLYQVYKLNGEDRIPVYQECYTDLQIKEIILKGFVINDEEVLDNVCS